MVTIFHCIQGRHRTGGKEIGAARDGRSEPLPAMQKAALPGRLPDSYQYSRGDPAAEGRPPERRGMDAV